jgi:hypothetical protein
MLPMSKVTTDSGATWSYALQDGVSALQCVMINAARKFGHDFVSSGALNDSTTRDNPNMTSNNEPAAWSVFSFGSEVTGNEWYKAFDGNPDTYGIALSPVGQSFQLFTDNRDGSNAKCYNKVILKAANEADSGTRNFPAAIGVLVALYNEGVAIKEESIIQYQPLVDPGAGGEVVVTWDNDQEYNFYMLTYFNAVSTTLADIRFVEAEKDNKSITPAHPYMTSNNTPTPYEVGAGVSVEIAGYEFYKFCDGNPDTYARVTESTWGHSWFTINLTEERRRCINKIIITVPNEASADVRCSPKTFEIMASRSGYSTDGWVFSTDIADPGAGGVFELQFDNENEHSFISIIVTSHHGSGNYTGIANIDLIEAPARPSAQLLYGRRISPGIHLPVIGPVEIPEDGLMVDVSEYETTALHNVYAYSDNGVLALDVSLTDKIYVNGMKTKEGASERRFIGGAMFMVMFPGVAGVYDHGDCRIVANEFNKIFKRLTTTQANITDYNYSPTTGVPDWFAWHGVEFIPFISLYGDDISGVLSFGAAPAVGSDMGVAIQIVSGDDVYEFSDNDPHPGRYNKLGNVAQPGEVAFGSLPFFIRASPGLNRLAPKIYFGDLNDVIHYVIGPSQARFVAHIEI